MPSELPRQASSHAPNEGPGGCVSWERFQRMRERANWWRVVAVAGWFLWLVAMVATLERL